MNAVIVEVFKWKLTARIHINASRALFESLIYHFGNSPYALSEIIGFGSPGGKLQR